MEEIFSYDNYFLQLEKSKLKKKKNPLNVV